MSGDGVGATGAMGVAGFGVLAGTGGLGCGVSSGEGVGPVTGGMAATTGAGTTTGAGGFTATSGLVSGFGSSCFATAGADTSVEAMPGDFATAPGNAIAAALFGFCSQSYSVASNKIGRAHV